MSEGTTQKFIQVKQKIINSINDDVFHSGEMIPSERKLIEYFGVSRITVRKALSELEHEGYLYKIQGKGTFVKDEKNKQNLFSLTSCTQDIIRMGMTPTRKVIDEGIIIADKKRQDKLNLKSDDKVFMLKRVYFADDEPINCTTTYIPYKYVDGIEHFDFSNASLYDVMENKYSIIITRSVRTVEAIIAHDEICDLLCVDNGVPLLLFRCTTYGKVKDREIPVETFECCYRSDKFSFFINQVR